MHGNVLSVCLGPKTEMIMRVMNKCMRLFSPCLVPLSEEKDNFFIPPPL